MLIDRIGLLKPAKVQSGKKPYMIVLHDTAGPSIKSAENTFLKERPGLGYHYMIDKDGTIYQYALPTTQMNHAIGFNAGTIGISFVGGWKYGPVNEVQIHSCVDLCQQLQQEYGDTLKYITGHKHCSPKRKIDPRFPGEPMNGINYKIDGDYMEDIAEGSFLTFERVPF